MYRVAVKHGIYYLYGVYTTGVLRFALCYCLVFSMVPICAPCVVPVVMGMQAASSQHANHTVLPSHLFSLAGAVVQWRTCQSSILSLIALLLWREWHASY